MRNPRVVFIMVCISCVLCTSAIAVPSRAAQTPAVQTSTQRQTNPQHLCFSEIFSRALPGKADYCLGLRDWNKGSYDNALQFLKLAAGWGNKSAQYTLGLIYYNGHHVPANPALGIAWIKLANQRHNDPQINKVALATARYATAAQRRRGEQLFRQMLPKYGDKVAAARAWRRWHNWRVRQGRRGNRGCIHLHGAQALAARRLGLAGTAPYMVQQQDFRPIPSVGRGYDPKQMRLIRQIWMANVQLRSGVCVTLKTSRHVVSSTAEKYFSGFTGTVAVGPLKSVPAPAASSGH